MGKTAYIWNISRLRVGTDGNGITTLVPFIGCPQKCRYCINDWCHDDVTSAKCISTEELYRRLRIDNIYFQATGGGVCFSGGEPTMHSELIKEFRQICEPSWKITIETALPCSHDVIRELIPVVDRWIIDVKDMNPAIYRE